MNGELGEKKSNAISLYRIFRRLIKNGKQDGKQDVMSNRFCNLIKEEMGVDGLNRAKKICN